MGVAGGKSRKYPFTWIQQGWERLRQEQDGKNVHYPDGQERRNSRPNRKRSSSTLKVCGWKHTSIRRVPIYWRWRHSKLPEIPGIGPEDNGFLHFPGIRQINVLLYNRIDRRLTDHRRSTRQDIVRNKYIIRRTRNFRFKWKRLCQDRKRKLQYR